MLFNSPLYGVFLIAVFAVFWLIRKERLARLLFLIFASYGFYFWGTCSVAVGHEDTTPLAPVAWSFLCLAIIFVGSSLDYFIGRLLGRIHSPGHRRALLLMSIFYYLGVLAIFKYFDFAADSITWLLHQAGLKVSPVHLRLILPFGISFFTFETMSYTIDVYRRQIQPADRYLDYLLFVCFFPHLVAGPIVRPREMLPQFRTTPVFDPAEQSRGLWLIATGLVKKVVIGDGLKAALVDDVFTSPYKYSSVEVLVGVYGYAVSLYSDFSGYSDIAIGSSLLFGYKLPQNFDAPYTAANLQDFWHRWHMSLSAWLRDYLYIPLGGSKGSAWRTYLNLMLTMLIGGLWHGASWVFVIWGGLHGIVLAGTRMFQRASPRSRRLFLIFALVPSLVGAVYALVIAVERVWPRQGKKIARVLGHVAGVFFTFHFVCFAWIFFRAGSREDANVMSSHTQDLDYAFAVLKQLGEGTTHTPNVGSRVLLLLGVGLVLHFVPKSWSEWVRERAFVRAPAVVQGVVLAAVAIGIHMVATGKSPGFVYGQF